MDFFDFSIFFNCDPSVISIFGRVSEIFFTAKFEYYQNLRKPPDKLYLSIIHIFGDCDQINFQNYYLKFKNWREVNNILKKGKSTYSTRVTSLSTWHGMPHSTWTCSVLHGCTACAHQVEIVDFINMRLYVAVHAANTRALGMDTTRRRRRRRRREISSPAT